MLKIQSTLWLAFLFCGRTEGKQALRSASFKVKMPDTKGPEGCDKFHGYSWCKSENLCMKSLRDCLPASADTLMAQVRGDGQYGTGTDLIGDKNTFGDNHASCETIKGFYWCESRGLCLKNKEKNCPKGKRSHQIIPHKGLGYVPNIPKLEAAPKKTEKISSYIVAQKGNDHDAPKLGVPDVAIKSGLFVLSWFRPKGCETAVKSRIGDKVNFDYKGYLCMSDTYLRWKQEMLPKGSIEGCMRDVMFDNSQAYKDKQGSIDDDHEPDPGVTVILGTTPVIYGWEAALQGMCEGEKRRVVVPAEMAYGEVGAKGVPPGAKLLYEIYLHSISFGSKQHPLCLDANYRELCGPTYSN